MNLPVEYVLPKYQDALYKAAWAILQDPADCQDAVQLCFIKYHQQQGGFRDEEHIRKWLFRTVMNQARDIRRAFWRKSKTTLDESFMAPQPAAGRDQEVFEAVSALPAAYRIVLQLYYYEDFSVREVSEITGLSESAVKKTPLTGTQLTPAADERRLSVMTQEQKEKEAYRQAFATVRIPHPIDPGEIVRERKTTKMKWYHKYAAALSAAMILLGSAGVAYAANLGAAHYGDSVAERKSQGNGSGSHAGWIPVFGSG